MGIVIQINRSNGGLPKRAIAGPAMVDGNGIEGDRHRNLRVHGGPNKAVLMISAEVVDDLAAKGFPLVYGSLGENLTVRDLDFTLWRKGQRYRVGEDLVIELTTMRSPCANLLVFGAPMPAELNYPREARGGFYARVVKPGLIIAGAPITLESDLA